MADENQSCGLPDSVCGKQEMCDRRVAYTLYQDLQTAVNKSVEPINVELRRAQNYKAHPHSVVFRVKVNLSQRQSRDADVQTYSRETKQVLNEDLVQSHLIDRSVDVIARLQDDRPVDNIRIVEGVLEACLVFQIGLRTLIDLQGYIHDEMARLDNIHANYDSLLAQYESAVKSGDSSLNDIANQISKTQNQLDSQRIVLQRLVNQIPFTVSAVRNENDFMDIYGDVDDTVVIHNFLQSSYVKNVLNDSPILARMFARLKHHWHDFQPDSASNFQQSDNMDNSMNPNLSNWVSTFDQLPPQQSNQQLPNRMQPAQMQQKQVRSQQARPQTRQAQFQTQSMAQFQPTSSQLQRLRAIR